MFRGFSKISLDCKGRIAIPRRYRDTLADTVVLTINPLDRSLWLYPLTEWELIEEKLAQLSDFELTSRRTKQMVRGYAEDYQLDTQGRLLIPRELRDYADLEQAAVILGQGNKFEIWDAAHWSQQRDKWLALLDTGDTQASDSLRVLSL